MFRHGNAKTRWWSVPFSCREDRIPPYGVLVCGGALLNMYGETGKYNDAELASSCFKTRYEILQVWYSMPGAYRQREMIYSFFEQILQIRCSNILISISSLQPERIISAKVTKWGEEASKQPEIFSNYWNTLLFS